MKILLEYSKKDNYVVELSNVEMRCLMFLATYSPVRKDIPEKDFTKRLNEAIDCRIIAKQIERLELNIKGLNEDIGILNILNKV